MFRAIAKRSRANTTGLPDRYWRLDSYRRVLQGTLYDVLPYDFHTEYTDGGEYIPIRDRAPSVRYNLCRTVVDDSVALLFSEGHFPEVDCEDPKIRDVLAAVIKETRLNAVMIAAATEGSIGSAAVLFRVLKGRVFFTILDALTLTPEWQADEPDQLVRVTEQYRVTGRTLAANGYSIPQDQLASNFWFMRVWDTNAETWFQPWLCSADAEVQPKADPARSRQHDLGFCPVAWMKNLPGGDEIDGACTFKSAIETSIEIDYQLSQAGRGLKYSSEPTLLIKEPAGQPEAGPVMKGGGNALIVSERGDAKLLEISGGASAAVIEYVRTLRELALESVHGSRASPERMTAAQSGRAIEMMNQSLVWLADNLRIGYGEDGLLRLLRMVVLASAKYPLTVLGEKVGVLDASAGIALKWPRFYAPTADDRFTDAQTLKMHTEAGHMSQETAIKAIAGTYDVEDTAAEVARIGADKAAVDARMKANGAQIQDRVDETA